MARAQRRRGQQRMATWRPHVCNDRAAEGRCRNDFWSLMGCGGGGGTSVVRRMFDAGTMVRRLRVLRSGAGTTMMMVWLLLHGVVACTRGSCVVAQWGPSCGRLAVVAKH